MKIEFNHVDFNIHKFTLLFSIEFWNRNDNPMEVRAYVLFWEFSFSIYK